MSACPPRPPKLNDKQAFVAKMSRDDLERGYLDMHKQLLEQINKPDGKSNEALPDIVDGTEFIARPMPPPPELVAGILHKGSKLVFGGGSKAYKTWTLLYLAVAVATGSDWLGFKTERGKVLFLNFEIQPFAFQGRIADVANSAGFKLQAGQFQIWNLRGHAADFRQLIPKIIERCRAENFALIVLDPIYKLYGNADENKASDVAALLNALEKVSVATGAAIAFGAHFAKGNSSVKEAIDRISGSGVFARDPDSLLIFTAHEDEGCFVVEPILRNFPPVVPFGVRWQFPLMQRDDDIDADKLKNRSGRKAEHSPADLLKLLPAQGLSAGEWLELAESERGMSRRTFYTLKKKLLEEGKIMLKGQVWKKTK